MKKKNTRRNEKTKRKKFCGERKSIFPPFFHFCPLVPPQLLSEKWSKRGSCFEIILQRAVKGKKKKATLLFGKSKDFSLRYFKISSSISVISIYFNHKKKDTIFFSFAAFWCLKIKFQICPTTCIFLLQLFEK